MAITPNQNRKENLNTASHLRGCCPRTSHYNGGGDELSNSSSTHHSSRHHCNIGSNELSSSHHSQLPRFGQRKNNRIDELLISSTHTSSSLMSSSHHMSSSTHSSSFGGFDDSSDSLDYSNSITGGKSSTTKFFHMYKKPILPRRSDYIAMDCEMVGTKHGKSMCARVVLTNWKARIIYDSYVQPTELVGDYRTFVSGITAADLEGAPTLDVVRAEVEEILVGKILVGHGLENDLSSLQIEHPWWQIRDTAYYEPFQRLRTDPTTGESHYVPRKLKDLCLWKLQREIQTLGHGHSPAEDARAALDLYKTHRPRWEACLTYQIQQLHKAAQRGFFTQHAMFEQQFLEQQQMFGYSAASAQHELTTSYALTRKRQ